MTGEIVIFKYDWLFCRSEWWCSSSYCDERIRGQRERCKTLGSLRVMVTGWGWPFHHGNRTDSCCACCSKSLCTLATGLFSLSLFLYPTVYVLCVQKVPSLFLYVCVCAASYQLSLSLSHTLTLYVCMCVSVCVCTCVHACLYTGTAGTISLFLCACVCVHGWQLPPLSLTVSTLLFLCGYQVFQFFFCWTHLCSVCFWSGFVLLNCLSMLRTMVTLRP